MRASKWLVCDVCGKDAYGAADSEFGVEVCDPCVEKNPPAFYTIGPAMTAGETLARLNGPGSGIPIPLEETGLVFKPKIVSDIQHHINVMYRDLAISQQRATERAIIGSTEV